jgi:transcription initiation factor TFIIIB Brf1 subunit/transcription initiation factor TFIIB
MNHDNYIRLWDTRILQDDYESDDDDEKDASMDEMKMRATTATGKSTGETVNNSTIKRESDDEWEDMDEDEDDEMDDSDGSDGNNGNDDNSKDSNDDDDDDDSDDESDKRSSNRNARKNKREGRFKTANERFFKDL